MTLLKKEIQIIDGMLERGDRIQDIASWFGINQGRISEVKDGSYRRSNGSFPPFPKSELPPRGRPGIKGRNLYEEVTYILKNNTEKGDLDSVLNDLKTAIYNYERHDTVKED